MSFEVLDPTYDESASTLEAATRLGSLDGQTIGIISNGKHNTRPFFAALADELRDTHGAAEVELVTKPNYSAPAGDDILDRAKAWHAMVSGIGD